MKKVVVITGASHGLGKEVAKLFSKKGHTLILSGRDEKGLMEFSKKSNIEIVIGDLTQKETRDKILSLVKKHKQLDILVNNAGITFIQPFEDNTEEQLNEILETNLKAPILLTQTLYATMKDQKSGTIVFINSAAGKQGYPNHTLYSTTKFGLSGFSQSLRLEAKQHNIRIISIHPGGIKTDLYSKLQNKPDTSDYMDPQKVAEVVIYLSETIELSPDEISISRLTK